MKKIYLLLCLYSTCMLYAADMPSMPKAVATAHKASQKNKEVLNAYNLQAAEGSIMVNKAQRKALDSIPYRKLVISGKTWITKKFGKCNTLATTEYMRNTISYEKVVIDSVEYYKMEYSCTNETEFCIPNYVFNNTLIREDTIEKKVYIYNSGKNKEELLFDFNLTKNDTHNSTLTEECGNELLNGPKIDSIYYKDGFKYFDLDYSKSECAKWQNKSENIIEGIGHTRGLGITLNPVEYPYTELICVSENNNIIYPNNLPGSCEIPNSIDANEAQRLFISPNPSATRSIIFLPKNNGIISVIDALGRVVHTATNVNTSTYELITSTFATGLYQVRYSYVGDTAVGKVMVQR